MFDDLIDIFSLHNLFEPLIAFFEDLIQGPGVNFGIATAGGHNKREIRQLLERHGIEVWGDLYDGDYTYLTVREDQARWAYKVMTSANVKVLWPKYEV